MDYIGGIEGMNFNPITNYNSYIKNNKVFDMSTNMDFENVLNKQTEALQNPSKVQGGIEMNSFDNILPQTAVETSDNSVDDINSTGTFVKNVSSSIGGGLNSVNNAIDSANKAQEAFAMGENVSVHDVMIASEKAALSMQMAMELRNKLMSAYTELNNIRV